MSSFYLLNEYSNEEKKRKGRNLMERKKKLKALMLVLSFVMVFTAVMAVGMDGSNVFGARRKNTQYSLSGAKYQLYTNSACTTKATDANGNNAILTTDANGDSNTLSMNAGTYYAKEVTASSGYKLDTQVYTVTVTDSNTATFTSKEPPVYAVPNFVVYKFDSEGEYGWNKLIGTEFVIDYYDVATKAEIASATPLDTWKFATRKMNGSVSGSYLAGFDFDTDQPLEGSSPFYTVNNQRVIPLGWITIRETKAPEGLALNDHIYYGQIKQSGSGGDATLVIEEASASGNLKVPVSVINEPQGIEFALKKETSETEGLISIATLAGAEYEVYYESSSGKKLVGKLTTDEDGNTNTLKKDLDGKKLKPGIYYIKETKAAPGYLLDKYRVDEDGNTYEWSGEEDIICTYMSNGQTVTKTIKGSFQNGEHMINAQAQTTNTPAFTYTLKSEEPSTEVLVYKTNSKTHKTIPSSVLQLIKVDQQGHETVLQEWASSEEEEKILGVPSGQYILREIEAPLGYDIAEDLIVEVSDGQIVDIVNLENIPIEIKTTATDAETGSHQGIFNESEIIKDSVKISGLWMGRTYRVVGTLIDKSTGKPFKDANGNDITAENEFVADGESATIGLGFIVDTTKFTTDTSAVVFEDLYRIDEDAPDEPVLIAEHEDIDDKDQTIVYGGIVGTTAVDATTGSHNVLGALGAVVKDTVKYKNLAVGTTYTVEGELYDKTTGKLTGIKASTKFKAEKANGSVVLEFKFDSSNYIGHKLVAYETLLANKVVINKHEDPNDADQTVNIPEVGTLAVNPECNEHIADADKITVKDTVYYGNLIPGKTYTVEGTLHYRDGLLGGLKTVMSGDKPLTAKATFTPETEDGTVEVTFKFDATDLQGKTIVVFEDLYEGEYLVATHADMDDENQSVHIPEIGTKIGKKDGDYVIDTVSYKNLVPGKKYKVKGHFVDKSSAKKIEGSDGETTFTPDKADGTVDVKLKPKDKGTVVAFETIYIMTEDESHPGTIKETKVGQHKDINDKAQSYDPQKPKTGDTASMYLFGTMLILTAGLTVILTARRRKLQK